MKTSGISVRASITTLILTMMALMVLAVFETPAKQAGAQRRPNIERLNGETASPKSSKSNKTDSATRSSRSKSRKDGQRDGNATNAAATEYPLTFVCSQPGTDIFVDGVKVGTAGEDGRLKVKLAPGRHIAKASRPQFREMTKHIDVGPGSAEIGFNLETVSPPATFKPVSAVTSAPPTESASKSTPPAAPAAETIIERFMDNLQNSSVTVDDWKEVLSQSEKALAQEPSNSLIKARKLFAHGQLAYLDNEHAIALVAFNEATKARSDFGLAYYGSGNAYYLNNLLPEAIKSYQTAILILPNFALAHKGLGDAFAKIGNRKDAMAAYQRAKQLGYPRPDLTLGIANILILDQQWKQALDELKPVAEQRPSAELLIAIGRCYEGLKNNYSAALTYTKATELDRNSADAFCKLGNILYNMREFVPAKEAFERAIMLDPKGEKINLTDARKKSLDSFAKSRK